MTDYLSGYPQSESVAIGTVIRRLHKAKTTWGSGEAFSHIEAAIDFLRELQEQAMKGHHRNPPPMRARVSRGTRGVAVSRLENRGLISEEAHAILYKHIEDGRKYRHNFVNATTLLAVERNGHHDVLITSPDGFPIWQDI